MSSKFKVLLDCLICSGIGTFIALSVNSWFWWTGALAGGLIGYLIFDFKMSSKFKILLSCLIGSGIGTFIALSVNSWFWWTGCLAGGLIGYLSFNFKNVIRAIPNAYKAIDNRKADLLEAVLILVFFSLPIGYAIIFNYLVESFLPVMGMKIIFLEGLCYIFLSMGALAIVEKLLKDGLDIEIFGSRTQSRHLMRFIFICSPLGLALEIIVFLAFFVYYLYYALYNLFYGIYIFVKYLILGVLSMPIICWKILKQLFLLIHSEIRLLCAIDSLVGVVAGYIISQAYSLNLLTGVMIGMAVGALLGLANYQIFSVWILKLAPKRNE